MNDVLQRLKTLPPIYVGLAIPLVIILILLIVTLFFSTPNQQKTTIPTPTPQQKQTTETQPIPTLEYSADREFSDEDTTNTIESNPNLQKTESLSDGRIQYTLQSTDPSRPNIIVVTNGEKTYERDVINQQYPLSILEFTSLYGQPDKVFTGSHYYGPTMQTYLYARYGYSLVVNPNNGTILEENLLPQSISINDYISKYGSDLTTPAP